MTTRILVITEDPTRDPYIAIPVIQRIFADLGISARVEPLRDPHIRGVDEALNPSVLERIIRANRMVSLFLLVCDRDCNRQKNVEKAAAREREANGKLIACLAVEELEVWMLALHRQELQDIWREIRSHCDPKEAFAEEFLRGKGWVGRFGQGYKRAMNELGASWQALQDLCPEVKELKTAIRGWAKATGR